jgi:transposase
MRKQRRFSVEFKRQVVEELLSGTSRPAQLCRRYDISSGLLYHWKRQYIRGRFDNEPTGEAAMAERIERLEQMVGHLTMEKEFLKKALQNTLDRAEGKESSLPGTGPLFKRSEGGANS